MRSFDIFRKLRDDIETSTWVGGMYTVLAFIIGTLLILYEIQDYTSMSWVKEFRVESDDIHSKMEVTIEIRMKQAPCYLISVHSEDELGHQTKPDILNFTRVDSNGNKLEAQSYPEESSPNYLHSEAEKKDVFASVDAKEGCDLYIQSKVDKVPGNIQISFIEHKGRFIEAAIERGSNFINTNYLLKSIHFGNESPVFKSLSRFRGEPLNYNAYLGIEPGDNKTLRSYISYFKVVPTKFLMSSRSVITETMQFSQSFKDMEVDALNNPTVTFKYDVSPITMIFRVEDRDTYYFIVQLCAVIGGIFAIMGIMNSMTWESITFLKKALSQSS